MAGLLTPSESLAVSGSEPLTLEISNLLRLPPLKGAGVGVGGELVSTSSKQKAELIQFNLFGNKMGLVVSTYINPSYFRSLGRKIIVQDLPWP